MISEIIASKLNISPKQVNAVIKLHDDGCTIPFISRYRKEATNNLDEVAIKSIIDTKSEIDMINKRRDFIINAINESGNLTDDLHDRLINSVSLTELEDLYLPFKPKRQTKAEKARALGLEPLAKIIMAQNVTDVTATSQRFLSKDVNSSQDAIKGALDIIAEWISENERARNAIRYLFDRTAVFTSEVVKGKDAEGVKYSNYFHFSRPLKYVAAHQLLAIRRGEKEGYLKVCISIDSNLAIDRLKSIFIKKSSSTYELLEIAIADSYKRLIYPSIENEYANKYKEIADINAINIFSNNLRQLLMSAPLLGKRILAIDPGYRTGCKVVCLDENGKFLHFDTIYPNPPQNAKKEAIGKLSRLVESYKIDAISLGNGTASRETEELLAHISFPRPIKVYVVNESGASIYSASKVAREEFPEKDVTVRGAISIGRRLLDPLAELVKIDPKSIGVGQYQYDVDQTKLTDALNFVVESCVNNVGVNVNTASKELLSHVSGISVSLAKNIIDYRNANGAFTNRNQLMSVPRMGAKSFEQSAGFLRIPEGDNVLDNSAVHPECYHIVELIAKQLNVGLDEIIGDSELHSKINPELLITDKCGVATITDILNELEKPGRDPRDIVKIVEFNPDIKTITDLKQDMILNGIVTNITQFGAFIDIGIKENGLLHVSEISDKRIDSPSQMLKLNQPVRVKVISVDTNRHRISLSMKNI